MGDNESASVWATHNREHIWVSLFLCSYASAYESSQARVDLELQLQAYATATATWVSCCICTTACGDTGSLTHWVRPGYWALILTGTMCRVLNLLSHRGTSNNNVFKESYACGSVTLAERLVMPHFLFLNRSSHYIWRKILHEWRRASQQTIKINLKEAGRTNREMSTGGRTVGF